MEVETRVQQFVTQGDVLDFGKTLWRQENIECHVRRSGVTCRCCCGSLEADCCGIGKFGLHTFQEPSLGVTVT